MIKISRTTWSFKFLISSRRRINDFPIDLKPKGASPLRLINQINKLIIIDGKCTCPHQRGFMQLLKSESKKISYEDDVLFRVR